LLLTTVLSILFLKGSFLSFTGNSGAVIKVTLTKIIRESSMVDQAITEQTFLLAFFVLAIPVLSILAIMLFKKRNLQLWLVKILILFIVALIIAAGSYTYIIMTKYDSVIDPGFRMAIPFLQLILSVLAYRGIKKDDDLVKSYDRLR
jgi:glucan phosphoethanolaminetransferase (alkaline phosphatase superfamily)